jgi:hypothetical protein
VPVEPVLIGIGTLVLLMVLWFLVVTPRGGLDTGSVEAAHIAALEQRVAALEPLRERSAETAERLRGLASLETRLHALETRPQPADPESRLAALDSRLQALEQRPSLEGRVQALEQRPVPDAAKLEALGARQERLAERQEALAGRVQELAQGQQAHDQALDQQAQQRLAALDAAQGQKLAALQAATEQQIASLQSALDQRLAAVEQAQKRLNEIEGRTARLAALDQLRAALTAGQPLGPVLGRLPDVPEALKRFATTPPPTESALKLSFEDAAREARAAADAAQRGDGTRPGVLDSAMQRLEGLVTVRRGDQVVWGDAAEAEIERARRALEAGDLDAALAALDKLPPKAKDAMQGWTAQARALQAARTALRRMAAG